MFTGVCLSTGGVPDQVHPPEPSTLPWEQTPPRADTAPKEQTPLPGSRHPPSTEHAGSMRGWYASYWNAILFRKANESCYRPQTKFANVMFSQVSVSHRGCLPLVPGGCVVAYTPPPPWADTPQADSPSPETPPWADTLPGETPPGQTPSPGRHAPGQKLPPPGRRSTSGRYASHWNAFLFSKFFI